MLKIRGLLDEYHAGEVDPGRFAIYAVVPGVPDVLVGYAGRIGGGGLDLVLFDNYASMVPPHGGGAPNPNEVTLKFVWEPRGFDANAVIGQHPRYVHVSSTGQVQSANP